MAQLLRVARGCFSIPELSMDYDIVTSNTYSFNKMNNNDLLSVTSHFAVCGAVKFLNREQKVEHGLT